MLNTSPVLITANDNPRNKITTRDERYNLNNLHNANPVDYKQTILLPPRALDLFMR